MTFEIVDGETRFACERCHEAFGDIRECDRHEEKCDDGAAGALAVAK